MLVFERDLGTSLLFFGLFVAMLYVATERVSWIVIGLALFVGGALLAWPDLRARPGPGGHLAAPVRPGRSPDRSYQLVQGLFGMASGGLLGTGLGEGRPDIVPFAESDFILASIGEELGLTGLFALLVLYALLVERGLRTAIGVRDGFGKLLAGGLAFSIALQCFVVAGGVTRVIPLTGSDDAVPRLRRLVAAVELDDRRAAAADLGLRAAAGAGAGQRQQHRRHPGGGGAVNTPLRRLAVVVAALFASLLASTTWVQFVDADKPAAPGTGNARTLYKEFGRERGPLLVAGEPVAESEPVDDAYKYLRQYPGGRLYSPSPGTTRSSTAPPAWSPRTATCWPAPPTSCSTAGSADLLTGRRAAGRRRRADHRPEGPAGRLERPRRPARRRRRARTRRPGTSSRW